jgi:transcriptional regulator with XRE-family HTH domain
MSETTDLIKVLRKGGLSQSEISRRTGIPQSRVSRWESGAAPVGADDALKLAALVSEIGTEGAPAAPALATEASDAR